MTPVLSVKHLYKTASLILMPWCAPVNSFIAGLDAWQCCVPKGAYGKAGFGRREGSGDSGSPGEWPGGMSLNHGGALIFDPDEFALARYVSMC